MSGLGLAMFLSVVGTLNMIQSRLSHHTSPTLHIVSTFHKFNISWVSVFEGWIKIWHICVHGAHSLGQHKPLQAFEQELQPMRVSNLM